MTKIFISSVSLGLGPYRAIATQVVAAQGYIPIVHEHFAVPHAPIMTDIRRKVSECRGVVAVIGPFFGNPSPWIRDTVMMSYAQHEVLFALKGTRPCFALISTPDFQPDPAETGSISAQSPEMADAQTQFIAEIKSHAGVGWTTFSNRFEFALALAKHRWEKWLDGR